MTGCAAGEGGSPAVTGGDLAWMDAWEASARQGARDHVPSPAGVLAALADYYGWDEEEEERER